MSKDYMRELKELIEERIHILKSLLDTSYEEKKSKLIKKIEFLKKLRDALFEF
jgi:uncharacterized protein YjgD (DUF1641 family)